MIFERKMKKYGDNLISKYAKNPYLINYESNKKRFPFLAKISIPILSVAVVGLVLGLTLSFMNNTTKYEIIYVDSIFGESENIDVIKPWNEKTITEKYPNFVFNDITYHASGSGAEKSIEEKYVENKAGNVVGTGFDEQEQLVKEKNGEVFFIKDINSEASLLVRYEGDNHYFAYFSTNVSFDTIQDIYNKLSPLNSMNFTYAYYYLYDENNKLHYIRFDDFDDKYIYEMLLDQVELNDLMKNENASQTYSKYKEPIVVVSYKSDRLGIDNLPLGIALNEDGYLIFTFAWQRYVYNIGTDKVEAFKNYLINNIKGYELVLKTDVTPTN